MRVLRFAIVGVLMVTASSSRVTMAQWPSPYADAQTQAEQAKQLRVQRKKQLILDSDKLLKLSIALRQQIYDSTSDTLSADSFRKATEIEKLAHSLRKQMKY
jgi:hypothetical protein